MDRGKVANAPVTARQRLAQGRRGWRALVVVAGLTAFAVGMTWPHLVDDGFGPQETGWFAPVFWLVVGVVLMLGIGHRLWVRYRPGGGYWGDVWQASQGELVDLVLSGAMFRGEVVEPGRPAGAGEVGWGLVQNGMQLASVPIVGHLAAAPLVVAGLAVSGVAAVAGAGRAGKQADRDREATRIMRGLARAELMNRLPALEAAHAQARGRGRAQVQTNLTRTRKAISAIERMGFTGP